MGIVMSNDVGWKLNNSYLDLPKSMFSRTNPAIAKSPKLTIFNYSLAKEIELNFSNTNDKDLASIFSGNKLPKSAETIAQAYAGHQFGHFTILGDGRALIFGEHLTKNNKRFDIQFKGSGKTPYSRGADGKAFRSYVKRIYNK